MAIVNIKIDTEKLGDTPKVEINGKEMKILQHVYFDWKPADQEYKASAGLQIKSLPNNIKDIDSANETVINNQTWKTACQRHNLITTIEQVIQ